MCLLPDFMQILLTWHGASIASSPGPARKVRKGPGSSSILPHQILRNHSHCRIKPRGTWSIICARSQKCRLYSKESSPWCVCHLARLQEIGGRSKSESAIYPYGLWRQTPPLVCWHWLGFQSTETICQNLCLDSMHPNLINTEDNLLQHACSAHSYLACW